MGMGGPRTGMAPTASVQHGLFGKISESFDTGAAENARQFDIKQKNRNQLFDLLGINFGSKKTPPSLGMFDPTSGNGLYSNLLNDQRSFATSQQGIVDQFGDSQRQRINRDFDAATGSALARMEARGLGSSNLSTAAQSQMDEARQQSRLGLEDQLLSQRLNVGQTNQGNVFNTQQNQITSQQQLMALLAQLL